MTFRTKPPITYLPPTPTEIREAAAAVELKTWSPDFVTDLANVAAGGEVLSSHQWRHLVEPTAGKRDKDGDYVLPVEADENYTKDAEKARALHQQFPSAENLEQSIKAHENICAFLRTVAFANVPGNSPIQKAVSLLKIMSEREGWSGGAEGDPLPIFIEGDPQAEAETLKDLLEDIESLDDLEAQLLEDEEDDEAKGAGSGHGRMQKTVKLAEEMQSHKQIWLRVSRHLDKLAKMKVAKSVKVRPDIEGQDVRQRPIKGFGEMHKLPQSAWALPSSLRNYRIATRAIQVRERVTREEKQQLLYMIIDCSGSMKGDRIHKAGGVLFNRLKAVVAGEAQIFIRFFDSRLFEEYHADSSTAAKELMKRFQKENFSGGGTKIANCVRGALERIEEIVAEGQLTRPELVVVTDGDDNVSSLKRENFGQTRMHAFIVECANDTLVELARETGGIGIQQL